MPSGIGEYGLAQSAHNKESEEFVMMWGYDFGWGWGWLFMAFGSVLWIAVLVALAWALIHWASSKTSAPTTMGQITSHGTSAMEILRQRYARGEIDRTTFEQMREQLDASSAPRP